MLNSSTSHAVLDAWPHGFMNGGHAHADALSLTLTVSGRPLLIDPGTASYVDSVLRDRFRSTAMHNTVVVDGRPQALPSGPFHWRTRANGRVETWRPFARDWCNSTSRARAPRRMVNSHELGTGARLRRRNTRWLSAARSLSQRAPAAGRLVARGRPPHWNRTPSCRHLLAFRSRVVDGESGESAVRARSAGRVRDYRLDRVDRSKPSRGTGKGSDGVRHDMAESFRR